MKYIASNVVSFGAGAVLGLTKDQAAARAAFITPVPGKSGMFTTSGPVQFKRGEEFFFAGELPKSLADSVEALRKAKADREATARAAVEARERAEQEAKAKAEVEAKAKAEQEANAPAEAEANGNQSGLL